MDVFLGPQTYIVRTVKLAEEGNQKVARLGAPDLAVGHCAMGADSVHLLKPNGEAIFQGSTTTTRAGDTWRQTASVFTAAGTTILDLRDRAQRMDEANRPYTWEGHLHFAPSLYQAMDQLEFQGIC